MYSSLMREKGQLRQGDNGRDEKWSEPGCTLKVELTKCVDELDTAYEHERVVRVTQGFGLSTWNHITAFCVMGKREGGAGSQGKGPSAV